MEVRVEMERVEAREGKKKRTRKGKVNVQIQKRRLGEKQWNLKWKQLCRSKWKRTWK